MGKADGRWQMADFKFPAISVVDAQTRGTGGGSGGAAESEETGTVLSGDQSPQTIAVRVQLPAKGRGGETKR